MIVFGDSANFFKKYDMNIINIYYLSIITACKKGAGGPWTPQKLKNYF